MRVTSLDHLVLTVTDIPATVGFYTRVCGMSHVVHGEDQRHALTFGRQRINLHMWGSDIEPKAALSTPGSADLCFVVDGAPQEVADRLAELEVPIVDGPVARAGAQGPITSIYVRDPDANLVELACYPAEPPQNGRAAGQAEGQTAQEATPPTGNGRSQQAEQKEAAGQPG